MSTRLKFLIALLLLCGVMVNAYAASDVQFFHPVIPLTPGENGIAFFTVTSVADDAILSVHSDCCVAVELHTDHRNLDSQRAIERLGAQREGVLRNHKRRPDGGLRHTVCYSVIDSEWPDVARWLAMRLERLAG